MYRTIGRLLTAWLLAQGAVAQVAIDTDPEPEEILEEITVTAHRVAAHSPLSVQVLDREELEQRLVRLGPDALGALPSLSVSRSGAFGSQAQIRVRGAEANHLQVVIDGIEVNDPATGSEFYFEYLDLAGIDRVEFLPGAQSALWGSDALAGVLQLLSGQEADLRRLELSAGANHEGFGRIELGDVLAHGSWRLTASRYATDGTNTSLTGDEDDGYVQDSLHFSARLNGGVSVVLRAIDAENEFDATDFATGLAIDADRESHVRRHAAKIALDRTFLDGRWKQVVEFKHLDTRTLTNHDGMRNSRFAGDRDSLIWLSHLNLTEAHRVTGLVEFEREGYRQSAAASPFGDPNYATNIDTTSAALEYRMNRGRVSAALSARFDAHSDFANIASYRAAFRHALRTGLSAFASLGTGTRNPGFVERFGYFPGSFIGNPRLRPEHNRHLSLGVEWRGDGGAQVTLNLFRDKLEDEINGFVFAPEPGGFTATNLDADSERRGMEFSFGTQALGVSLAGAYMLVDSNSPDGETEIRRPRHQGHLSVSRSFMSDRLDLLLGARLTGEMLDTDFSASPSQTVSLPGRELVYFTARYQVSSAIRLFVRLENLLADAGQEVYGFASPGRTGSVGLQARW